MKKRNFLFPFAIIMTLVGSLWAAPLLSDGIRNGLELSYRAVLPALLPAMVLCGLLEEGIAALPLPPTVSLWLVGQFCGYPLGIRTVTRCYKNGVIDEKYATALSACCANASPAFLVNYIGRGILNSTRSGWILFLGQCVISFHFAVLSGIFQGEPVREYHMTSFAKKIAESFKGAAMGGLQLTLYITVFSAISSLLKPLPHGQLLYALLESVGGTEALEQKNFYLIALLVGFSGCSVIFQNGAYLAEAELPLRPMIIAKAGYALLLPPVAFLLAKNTVFSIFVLSLGGFLIICFDKFRERGYNKINYS